MCAYIEKLRSTNKSPYLFRPVCSQVCIKDPFESDPKPEPPKPKPAPAFKPSTARHNFKSPADMVTSSQMPGKQVSIDAFFSRSNVGNIAKGSPIKGGKCPVATVKPMAAIKPQIESNSPSGLVVGKAKSVDTAEKPQNKKFSFGLKSKNR